MLSSKLSLKSKDPVFHKVPNPNQESRYLHASILFDYYIISIGGNDDDDTEDISIFDTLTYEWPRPILIGTELKYRSGHTACLFNQNKIIVYGGDIDEQPSNEIIIITISCDITLDCEEIALNDENPFKCYHSAEVFDEKMYVFGGVDREEKALNELWSFDLSKRLRHKSVLVGNKIYIFGGRNSIEPYVRVNDLYSLDLDTLHWSEVRCGGTIPSPRTGMGLVEHSGSLYLFGGCTGDVKFSNELFSLNLNDNKWKAIQAKNEHPSERANLTMISYENGIFIIGGADDDEEDNEDVYEIFYLNLLSTYKEKKLMSQANEMSKLYLHKKYSDVLFLVEGEKIYGHKILLGTRCRYFSNMFSSGMMESNQKEIEITDCKASTFKALLKYIYCGEVNFTGDFALDLLVLSNKWLLKELEEECEDYLAESLIVENALERAQLAHKLESTKLMNSVNQLIIEKTHELQNRGDLYQMPSTILVKVIFDLKDRVDQKVKGEEELGE